MLRENWIKMFASMAVMLMLIVASGCRTQRGSLPPALPTLTSSSTANNVTAGGTSQAGYTKPDSASIKALLACDSLGNVYIKQIASLQMGHSVKPSVTVSDNIATFKCDVDSLAVYEKWLRFYNQASDTSSNIQYLPGTVTNELTWLQKLLIKFGWLFAGCLVTGAIYIVIKLKF